MGKLPTMAFVVARPGGAWEIRESRATAGGPRARTLATFRELTPEVIDRARARAATPVAPEDLVRAAVRAGAPVGSSGADHAARALLRELARGRRPAPVLRRLLAEALASDGSPGGEDLRAGGPWLGATPHERAEALRDLLLLTDRLPPPRRRSKLRFPRMDSAPT